jgi:hypothetical protein
MLIALPWLFFFYALRRPHLAGLFPSMAPSSRHAGHSAVLYPPVGLLRPAPPPSPIYFCPRAHRLPGGAPAGPYGHAGLRTSGAAASQGQALAADEQRVVSFYTYCAQAKRRCACVLYLDHMKSVVFFIIRYNVYILNGRCNALYSEHYFFIFIYFVQSMLYFHVQAEFGKSIVKNFKNIFSL